MEHFWDTVDTIGEGFGFSLFGARHLVTLALYIGFAALSCKLYKAADKALYQVKRSGKNAIAFASAPVAEKDDGINGRQVEITESGLD